MRDDGPRQSWRDAAAPPGQRAEALFAEMTFEEKVGVALGDFETVAHFGVPALARPLVVAGCARRWVRIFTSPAGTPRPRYGQIQQRHVVSMVKHFIGNNAETCRTGYAALEGRTPAINTVVGERRTTGDLLARHSSRRCVHRKVFPGPGGRHRFRRTQRKGRQCRLITWSRSRSVQRCEARPGSRQQPPQRLCVHG